MASISRREGIRWVPDAFSEPTSTLVLTSPGKYFVDLRILRRHFDDPTPSSPASPYGISDAVDWAIAGISTSTPIPFHAPLDPRCTTPKPTTRIHRGTWHHLISSRQPALRDEEALDSGDNYAYTTSDGRDVILEIGEMVNPATGAMQVYEELWAEDEAGEGCWVWRGRGYDGQGREVRKGMVIRVGGWCQGFVKVCEPDGEGWKVGVSLQRWKREGEGEWVDEVKLGQAWMPSELCKEGKGKLGDVVEKDGLRWELIEKVE